MSSFNALNGVPASANPFLIKTILREEWGFDGPVVSDYTASWNSSITASRLMEQRYSEGVEFGRRYRHDVAPL